MNAKKAREKAEEALQSIFKILLINSIPNTKNLPFPKIGVPVQEAFDKENSDGVIYDFYMLVIGFLRANYEEKSEPWQHQKTLGQTIDDHIEMIIKKLIELFNNYIYSKTPSDTELHQILNSPTGKLVILYLTFLSLRHPEHMLLSTLQFRISKYIYKTAHLKHSLEFLLLDHGILNESDDNPFIKLARFFDAEKTYSSHDELLMSLEMQLKESAGIDKSLSEFILFYTRIQISIKAMLFLFRHMNQFENKEWIIKAYNGIAHSPQSLLSPITEKHDFIALLNKNKKLIELHLNFMKQFQIVQKDNVIYEELVLKLQASELKLLDLIPCPSSFLNTYIYKADELIRTVTAKHFDWRDIDVSAEELWKYISIIFTTNKMVSMSYLQIFNEHWETVAFELFKHNLLEDAFSVIAVAIEFGSRKSSPFNKVFRIYEFINKLKTLADDKNSVESESPLYQKEVFLKLIEDIEKDEFDLKNLSILQIFIKNNLPNIAAWLLEELRAVMPGLKKNLFNTEPSLDTYETRILPLKEQMITIIETLLPQDTSTKTEALKSLVYQRLESTFLASTYAEKRICATDKPTEPKIDKPKNKKRRKQRNKKGRKEARQQNVLHGGGGGGPHPFTHFKDQPRIHRSSLPKPLLELANLITRETKEYLVLSGAAVLSLYLNRQDIDDYDCQLADVNLNQLNNLLIKNGYPSKLIGKKHPILTLTIMDEHGEYDIEISSIEKGDKDLTKALKETHKYRDFKLTTLTCILTSEDYLDISGLPGAIKAIKEKKISAVYNHPDLFYSDPTRLIRFVKLRLQFPDYTVEENLARIIATLNMKKCFEDCILNKEEGKTNQGRIGTSLERKLFSRFPIKDVLNHLNQIGLIEGLTGFTCEQINLITPIIINHCHDKQSGYDKKQRFFLILAINYCLLNPKQPDFKQWPFYQVAKHLKREHRDLFFYVQQQLLKPDEDYFVNPPQKQKNDVDDLINEIAYANKQTKTEQIETKTELPTTRNTL